MIISYLKNVTLKSDKGKKSAFHSLKDSVLKYEQPFLPVAENDWEVLS